jgi:NAD(P)H-dependent FMN reductase
MMPQTLRVLVLLGSVRRGRQSERVATFVMARLARLAGVEATLADLASIGLPVMEERLGRLDPAPPGLAELGAAIERADAIVIVSPEYNHGYPGALKNALDYYLPEFKRTPVALVTVSAGGHGGVNAWAQLVTVLVYMGAFVLPQSVAVSKVQDAFAADGTALDPAYERRVDSMLAELVWLAAKLAA